MLTANQRPGSGDVEWEATPARGAGTIPERVAKKLESGEELITSYAGVRIRMDLDRTEARLWSDALRRKRRVRCRLSSVQRHFLPEAAPTAVRINVAALPIRLIGARP